MQRDDELGFETIQGFALSFQRVYDVHCADSLTTTVFCVRNRIPDHIFKKILQNSTSLFVDQTTDSLHTSSPSEPPDSRFCDSLNIVSRHFSVSYRATLPKTFTAFSRHDVVCLILGFYTAQKKNNELFVESTHFREHA